MTKQERVVYMNEYARRNPDKVKEYRLKSRLNLRLKGKKYPSQKQIWFKKIVERDGNMCKECGTTENLTIEHKIPKGIGGKDSYKNLEILCLKCNMKRYKELVNKALKQYFNL